MASRAIVSQYNLVVFTTCNPYPYATNEYWDWEKKYNKEAFNQTESQEYDDWDHTETYDDGY